MTPAESSEALLHRFQRTFLFALVLGVCVVSIPNIYFAVGAFGYPQFWLDTLGHKPMHPIAALICRGSIFYCGTAIALPLVAAGLAFFPLILSASTRIVIAALSLACIQLLLSLYVFWHEWAINTFNARIYP